MTEVRTGSQVWANSVTHNQAREHSAKPQSVRSGFSVCLTQACGRTNLRKEWVTACVTCELGRKIEVEGKKYAANH